SPFLTDDVLNLSWWHIATYGLPNISLNTIPWKRAVMINSYLLIVSHTLSKVCAHSILNRSSLHFIELISSLAAAASDVFGCVQNGSIPIEYPSSHNRSNTCPISNLNVFQCT